MWIVGLLVIIAAYEGVKTGLKVLRDDYRKSRDATVKKGAKGKRKAAANAHHATGWWLAETLRGFPQFRHGAARGWHDARRRHLEALRDRERSAADHAEARRDAFRDILHERTRRRNAERDIHDATIPAVENDWQPLRLVDDGQPAVPPLPSDATRNAPPRPGFTPPPGSTGKGTPGGCVKTPGEMDAWDGTPAGHVPPGTMNALRPPDPSSDHPVSAPKEGSPPVAGADTTYTQVHDRATQGHQEAAEELQRANALRQEPPIGDMLPGMNVKDETLSAAADYDEWLKDRQEVAERGEAVTQTLINAVEKEHGGIQEATDNAPIAEPANPDFYGR